MSYFYFTQSFHIHWEKMIIGTETEQVIDLKYILVIKINWLHISSFSHHISFSYLFTENHSDWLHFWDLTTESLAMMFANNIAP